MKKHLLLLLFFFLLVLFIGITPNSGFADGTEILDSPSIPIASGTGVTAAGTGLTVFQPGTININIPSASDVIQVLLYWQGTSSSIIGDNSITVQGIDIIGSLIGGPVVPGAAHSFFTYRADITNLGLISSGANSISVGGLDFDVVSNGAGILVILDDGSTLAEIDIRDGQDVAYIYAAELITTKTEPQTFTFASSTNDRTANLSMFFSSVSGPYSGGGFRPSSIEITVNGVTNIISNLLDSSDGAEWDTVNLDLFIPAGASSLTVQAFSRDDLGTGQTPASLFWLTASLSISPGDRVACRVTAGGNKKNAFCDSDSLEVCAVDGTDTWGGQFGAPPRIAGNWTHHHAPTVDDSFVFHSNEMFNVECSDPGPFCQPARYAPNRQIDFMGLGVFNSKKGSYESFPEWSVCFQVHLEDAGEGGPGSRKKHVTEPCTHCPGTPIVNALDCPNCKDYYMIEIYDTPANDGNICTGNIIYVNGPGAPENCTEVGDPQLGGYFTDRGNVQLHPDKNGPN